MTGHTSAPSGCGVGKLKAVVAIKTHPAPQAGVKVCTYLHEDIALAGVMKALKHSVLKLNEIMPPHCLFSASRQQGYSMPTCSHSCTATCAYQSTNAKGLERSIQGLRYGWDTPCGSTICDPTSVSLR